MAQGYAKTYVALKPSEGEASGGARVVGFYTFMMQSYTSREHARHFGLAYGDGKPSKSLASVKIPAPGFYLMYLGVRSDLQRQGVGKFLVIDAIGRLEHYAKQVGGRFITVLPDHEDPAGRRDLVAYYKQFGFREAAGFGNLMVRKLG